MTWGYRPFGGLLPTRSPEFTERLDGPHAGSLGLPRGSAGPWTEVELVSEERNGTTARRTLARQGAVRRRRRRTDRRRVLQRLPERSRPPTTTIPATTAAPSTTPRGSGPSTTGAPASAPRRRGRFRPSASSGTTPSRKSSARTSSNCVVGPPGTSWSGARCNPTRPSSPTGNAPTRTSPASVPSASNRCCESASARAGPPVATRSRLTAAGSATPCRLRRPIRPSTRPGSSRSSSATSPRASAPTRSRTR